MGHRDTASMIPRQYPLPSLQRKMSEFEIAIGETLDNERELVRKPLFQEFAIFVNRFSDNKETIDACLRGLLDPRC